MPLPAGGSWPPEHCTAINDQIATWDAWYRGDTDCLAAIYGGDTGANDTTGFFASQQGGFKAGVRRAAGAIRRWFWGQRENASQPRTRLHVPLAGDIAETSAALLFGEQITVTAAPLAPGTDTTPEQPDEATQAALDALYDEGGQAMLLEAAEVCSGLGGVYLRLVWDPAERDHPWLTAVHPDVAIPDWTWGRLSAVTFWRELGRKGKTVWRHLERHEPGRILHGLYAGEDDELGRLMPLTDHEATAHLASDQLVNGNEVRTGTQRLTAVYVPNVRPNRVWRKNPAAAYLGRADIAGAEPLLDALDLTWSSWMRDIDLGKARLIVPREYMRSFGKGAGAGVDLDQEVYEGLNVMSPEGGAVEIKEVQFDIRVEQHSKSADAIKTEIVTSAGYAPQTFGLVDQVASTATEVESRERRTFITRDRKIRYWVVGLGDITETFLDVYAAQFGAPVVPQRPTITWPDGVSVDPEAQARTLQLLDAAGAVSTEEKVRRLNPDWDDVAVAEEVARIDWAPVEDPATFTGVPGPTGPTMPPEVQPGE